MPNFSFTYDPGTTLQQMIGMEMAGKIWSSYLTDNTTINIHVGVASSSLLPTNVIGGALPGMRASEAYSNVYNSLLADKKSADDTTAVNNLSAGTFNNARFYMNIDGLTQSTTQSTSTMNLTRANAKALGMSFTDGATALDGYILFSNLATTSVKWNYDYTRSAAAGQTLDFLSTAVHEIGHVLGYVSGIDKPGWLSSTMSMLDPLARLNYNANTGEMVKNTTPLDLFRYSSSSKNAFTRDMTYGSVGGAKYFSIDRGQTAIASFSTGSDTSLGGDGQQASHWKAGVGMMSPTLALGQRPTLTATDLRAFDVMGWDVASTGANTSINLSSLKDQVSQSLATRAGQGTNWSSWVNSNLATSPLTLTKIRLTDIVTMVKNSVIYGLGDEEGDTFWQKLPTLFQKQGVFSSLDELDLSGLDLTTDGETLQPEITMAMATANGALQIEATEIGAGRDGMTDRFPRMAFGRSGGHFGRVGNDAGIDLSSDNPISTGYVGGYIEVQEALTQITQAWNGGQGDRSGFQPQPSENQSSREYRAWDNKKLQLNTVKDLFETPGDL